MKEPQSSKQMILRSSPQRGATSRTVSSIGLPRKELTTNTPAARDCFSTYSTSLARKPGAEFQHDPFRQVLRPDRDPLARLEASEQGARGALRLGMEFKIGPLPA